MTKHLGNGAEDRLLDGLNFVSGKMERVCAMKKSCFVMIFTGCILLVSCSRPVITILVPGANQIELSNSSPPIGYDMIGSVTGTDGEGCGIFGYNGTYERASIDIRNTARSIGADYIQITGIMEPHSEIFCYDNNFVLYGIAYKRSTNSSVTRQHNMSQ